MSHFRMLLLFAYSASYLITFHRFVSDAHGEPQFLNFFQKEQVEDRLKFYETGELPKKNLDVMVEAMEAVKEEAAGFKLSKKEEKKKKKSKRKAEEMEPETEEIIVKTEADEDEKPKKKKIKVEQPQEEEQVDMTASEKKKKKKKKKADSDDE